MTVTFEVTVTSYQNSSLDCFAERRERFLHPSVINPIMDHHPVLTMTRHADTDTARLEPIMDFRR